MSQGQVLRSAHLGAEDDFGDGEASGSAVDEKKQAERIIKISAVDEKKQAERFMNIIEKPIATAPTKAPEKGPEPAPAPKLVLYVPDDNLGSVRDVPEYGSLTALFEAESSRPENASKEPDSSPGLFAMLRAAALSTRALLLTIPVPNLSLWRRPERSQQSKRPDVYRIRHHGPTTHKEHRP